MPTFPSFFDVGIEDNKEIKLPSLGRFPGVKVSTFTESDLRASSYLQFRMGYPILHQGYYGSKVMSGNLEFGVVTCSVGRGVQCCQRQSRSHCVPHHGKEPSLALLVA